MFLGILRPSCRVDPQTSLTPIPDSLSLKSRQNLHNTDRVLINDHPSLDQNNLISTPQSQIELIENHRLHSGTYPCSL